MKSKLLALLTAVGLAFAMSGPVLASEDSAGDADDYVYGWQLMTEQERAEHRATMRSLNTREERAAYRLEHHRKMQLRAQERGVTLPEEPLPRGRGMGYGPRDGSGRGMGGGPGWQ